MILYHGSTEIVERPVYGKGKTYNDYGRGFYCTEQTEMAKEWACSVEMDGFINQYELDIQGMDILNLSSEDYSILNWLAVLMENRIGRLSSPVQKSGRAYLIEHFLPDYQQRDLIIGYRADDSYFSFARSFVSNEISLRQLSYAMHLGKLGEQVVLKSRKAFEKIRFTAYYPVESRLYYPKRKARDDEARNAFYRELEKDDFHGIFMRDIILEKMENGDERLQ